MTQSPVLRVWPLEFQWQTTDPFLFCVHHEDFYPAGNAEFGPRASLAGRNIGSDFAPSERWRMYHGHQVPGFPVHPHRGFETVTIVLKGFVDHSDSMGAAGRYGGGDVQWMTAGSGVQHAEMFPLLNQDRDNTVELFQIWLNLPAANKMVEPHYRMFWREEMPTLHTQDVAGNRIDVAVIAGEVDAVRGLAPPPESWAANADNHVAIWLITLAAHARWTLPATLKGLNRTLYYYAGTAARVAGHELNGKSGVMLDSASEVSIESGSGESQFLLLQGRPIAEPVASYGPFVMNTRAEIEQAFADFRRTEFGGWPWPATDPVHGATRGRFALYADGRLEEPTESPAASRPHK